MYKRAEDLIENVFTSKTKALILRNIQTGIYAFNQFISDNRKYFENINMCNCIHELRAYSIGRQFMIESQKDTSPYTVTTKALGSFKYKVNFLNFDGAIATFAKTNKAENMPRKSRYKIELSRANNFQPRQLSIFDYMKDVQNEEIAQSFNSPNYCIFTYGVNGDILTHCRIIIPDSEYKGYIQNISILEAYSVAKKEDSVIIENIPVLKKELQQKLNING